MAKRFFYVCAGLLCLALVYRFGTNSAAAQSQTVEAAHASGTASMFATGVVGRTLYCTCGGGGEGVAHPYQIPGGSRIVATGPAVDGVCAILENGDVYYSANNGPGAGGFQPWVLQGNLLGSATSTPSTSWGSLKARYRGERPQVAQDK